MQIAASYFARSCAANSRVGGVRATGVDAPGAKLGHGGGDDPGFFRAHPAFLAAMRIERGNGEAGCADAEIALQGCGDDDARRTISAVVSSAGTSASATWTVSGTVRRLGPASIITASSAATPQAAATNSVWPGWAKPISARRALAMGPVTSPLAAPEAASRAASLSEARANAAPSRSGAPGR